MDLVGQRSQHSPRIAGSAGDRYVKTHGRRNGETGATLKVRPTENSWSREGAVHLRGVQCHVVRARDEHHNHGHGAKTPPQSIRTDHRSNSRTVAAVIPARGAEKRHEDLAILAIAPPPPWDHTATGKAVMADMAPRGFSFFGLPSVGTRGGLWEEGGPSQTPLPVSR